MNAKIASPKALLPAATVALCFLASIAGIRYVTLDDRWYAAWVWHDSWLGTAYQIAVAHGRFPKPSSYTYFFPYLFESQYLQAAIRLGTILLGTLLAGNLLRRAVGIRGSGILFVLCFFAFAQNSDSHNLFVAYPFAWEFSWICWMAGLLGLMVALKRQSMTFALAGAIIWLVGLQEGFVPQTAIYLLVALAARGSSPNRWRYLVPYFAGLAVWLAVWVFWRVLHPSSYEGAQLRLDAPTVDIAKVIATYSLGGLPFATMLQGDWHMSWYSMRSSLDALSIIKAIAVFMGFKRILQLSTDKNGMELGSRIVWTALALLSLTFLPNIMLGLTPKYQQWVELGSHAYLYSHFSYFAWIGLAVIGLLALNSRWPSRSWILACSIFAALGSLVTDASNFDVNRRQEQLGRRWQTMDSLLQSVAFSNVPAAAGIWMKDSSVTGTEKGDADYWQYVAAAKTQKKLTFSPDLQTVRAAPGGAYYLYVYDEPMTTNQYVVFAPLEASSSESQAVARHFYIFPNSPNPILRAGGRLSCQGSRCIGAATANGQPSPALFDSSFVVSASPGMDSNGVGVVDIDVPTGASVQTIWVNFARNPVDLPSSISVSASRGFYGWESDGISRWNWASLDSELQLRNDQEESASVILEFTLVAGDARSVSIRTSDGTEVANVAIDPTRPGNLRLPLELGPGAMTISLHSDPPALHELDSRKLSFQLRELGLRLSEQ